MSDATAVSEDRMTGREAWELIAEAYDGEPAGDIAELWLQSMEESTA